MERAATEDSCSEVASSAELDDNTLTASSVRTTREANIRNFMTRMLVRQA